MTDSIVNNPLEIIVTGDLVLDVPDADYWLSGIAPALQAADIAIGHVEVPHSHSEEELEGDVPAPGADPENLKALKGAGFDAVTLAGNHIADCGARGIADTMAGLDTLGIKHTGAALNLIAARKPVHMGRVALLSYNCVGPEIAWAGEDQAGCAYLRVDTEDGSPIAPAANLTSMSDQAVEILKVDIATIDAEFIIIALHKGIVHTPAKLAPYERAIAHAAIDAGAHAVIGHHAHIVRGIEFYQGRPIFHGLGNGCVVTHALSPGQDNAKRAEWVERRKKLFGFEPDPAYTLAPFHPEAVNAMLGKLTLYSDGRVDVGIVPVDVEAPGRPVLAHGARAIEIANYIAKITIDAGLPPISFTADFKVAA